MAVSSVLLTKFSASVWFCVLFYKLWVLSKKKHLYFSLNFHWVRTENSFFRWSPFDRL